MDKTLESFLEKEFKQGDLVWYEHRHQDNSSEESRFEFYQVEVVGTYGEFPFELYVIQWLDEKPNDAGFWETKVVSKVCLEKKLHKTVRNATKKT